MSSLLAQSLAANFALVPGKSTREIRSVSAQGDVIRRETFAYALGETEPRMLAHTTAAYSSTHNADGTLASNTGTTVTPEYHTYGVEVIVVGGNTVGRGVRTAPSGGDETGQDDTSVGRGVLTAPQPYPNGSSLPVGFGANGTLSTPVRVHEVRYGRADSPRFTRTYTDGFGDVIREERSGANGATLVTENEYDAFGRLVATAETDKPLVEYAYDEWGDRVAREESTDDEWRLAATQTSTVIGDDGEVWRETMATRSCSDAAIAPLVTAQRTRLSASRSQPTR